MGGWRVGKEEGVGILSASSFTMPKPLGNIVKSYPARGPMHQYRFDTGNTFHCIRCGCEKTAKLISILNEDWDKRLCNACYGRLLSIFEIKASDKADTEKVEELSQLLFELTQEDAVRETELRLKVSEQRMRVLSDSALRFLATSETVVSALSSVEGLDWSPAVIGICKALEVELINRFMAPLRDLSKGINFDADLKDKDLVRVAKYCTGSAPPPELGTICFFLRVVSNSQTRVNTSPMLKCLKDLFSKWPRSGWLVDANGALKLIAEVTSQFRNKAAHIEQLGKADYLKCYELVAGKTGALWD